MNSTTLVTPTSISAKSIGQLLGFLATRFHILWALPAVLLIRLIRPIMHIRLGSIRNDRIGHLTTDSSYYLANLPHFKGQARVYHWFWFNGESCNQFWSNKVSEKLYVRWWIRYLDGLNRKLPGGDVHTLSPLPGSRDTSGFFQQDVQRFSLSESENDMARKWLRDRGWKDDERFVCLLVRDSKYLSSKDVVPSLGISINDRYHSYRDSNIETYSDAVRFLLAKGYWVIRMGKAAKHRMPVHHPKLIDYPFLVEQPDLMDIWLTLNCHFFISTGTGLDILPSIYKKPSTLFVNANPLTHLHSWHQMTWVPKHLIRKDSKALLSLSEHFEHVYFDSAQYDAAGISMVDLSAEEILAATIEHEARINGQDQESPQQKMQQEKFWSMLRQWPQFNLYHRWIHPDARVGSDFLRQYE